MKHREVRPDWMILIATACVAFWFLFVFCAIEYFGGVI